MAAEESFRPIIKISGISRAVLLKFFPCEEMMSETKLHVPLADCSIEELIYREWIVTNGLGGYASGTILGINTRRHHGLFVPNLGYPRGRTILLPHLSEFIIVHEKSFYLSGREFIDRTIKASGFHYLKEFFLDWQTPTWIFKIDEYTIEKKVFMPYGDNTVYVSYKLIDGDKISMQLHPYLTCRKHDSQLGYAKEWPFTIVAQKEGYEVSAFTGAPVVRMAVKPFRGQFVKEKHLLKDIFYRKEFFRGLDCVEDQSCPGHFMFDLKRGETVYFVASTEQWDHLTEDPRAVNDREIDRRKNLVKAIDPVNFIVTQLTLAADQFIILPHSRREKNPLIETSSDRVTVIAGYHWFTDWGRDTMISLEGLTLCTGRYKDAKIILETFGHYVKNGLLPNHFLEGSKDAIYNTVDATLWYFHAIDRYYQITNDFSIIESLYPTLQNIIDCHCRGTDFGIHMDPADSLIQAAADGYQLTWMDAKVDEWVVTPRRGKPVEIQALWFNALKLMEIWSNLLGKPEENYEQLANEVFKSFNTKFWYENGQYLYDVIDTNQGDDASLRPNQIFSIALHFPVLHSHRWKSVVDLVEAKLLTPFGLRTLDPADKDYHGYYRGNRWERDAAYHQGLVWPWLIGGFMDAWKKVYQDQQKAGEFLKSFELHLTKAGIGTISEIFDGDAPYCPRGCIAQAWSVAEVLRCIINFPVGQPPPK
jgi:predicted glycogen debranching enzyme